MNTQENARTSAGAQDASSRAVWLRRIAVAILCIDIACQALLVRVLTTHIHDGSPAGLFIPFVFSLLVITVGTLIALGCVPAAIARWRRTGKASGLAILSFAALVGPIAYFAYVPFESDRRHEYSKGMAWAEEHHIRKAQDCTTGSSSFQDGCRDRAPYVEAYDGPLPLLEKYVLHDGEVYDKETKLTWTRCSVGLTWGSDGRCHGEFKLFTFYEAQKLGDGLWRLPTVDELTTLIDHRRTAQPAIDMVAFPDMDTKGDMPRLWTQLAFWSSSTSEIKHDKNEDVVFGWYLRFYPGQNASSGWGGHDNAARLVRGG